MNNAQIRNGVGGQQDATLQVGEVSQTVMVTAAAPEVNMTSSALAGSQRSLGSGRALGTLPPPAPLPKVGAGAGGGTGGGFFRPGTNQTVQDLALNGRDYNSLAQLQSGSLNGLMQASTPAAAEGQDLGDLFEYKLKDRVTIRKNQSAMVPILQSEIRAEKVSLWTAAMSSGHPLRGVWLTNTSGETLDGGNFSVLEDEVFAGQGLIEPIKPDERRLLSYASDLGMLVRAAGSASPQRSTRVSIAHGVMVRTSEVREKKTYTVRNEDSSPRTLIVEHPARFGWNLSKDSPRPEETSLGAYRFRVLVAPKQSTSLEINESHPIETRIELNNIDDDQLAAMVKEGSVNPEIQQALRQIIDQKAQVAAIDSDAEKRESEITSIYDDQQRLRENLKALKGSAEEKALTQRYTQQLSDQETHLDKLRIEKQELEKKSEAAQEELDKMIQELAMEVTL